MEKLFQKYNIRPLQIKLKIENFDQYRQVQAKKKTVHCISTDQCKIILSSLETDEIIRKLQNKKQQNESEFQS